MKISGTNHVIRTIPLVLALMLLLTVGFVSCGGGDAQDQPPDVIGEEGSRLPPGITEADLEDLDLGDAEPDAENKEEDGETRGGGGVGGGAAAQLAGAGFTVVDVTRNDSNKKVISSGQREIAGDYLEVELALENAGDEVIDLSQYSFRLESPAIQADEYRSYYGDSGSFGKYVSEHVISAVLLDYADLTPVLYKLKIGESLEGVFLFFDLNPQRTAKNEAFSPDGEGGDTHLVIHKLRGTDAGEEIEMSLAGFAV